MRIFAGVFYAGCKSRRIVQSVKLKNYYIMALPFMTAEEAALLIPNGAVVGMGGFTPAGAPKDVPTAIAHRAEAFHAEGKPYKIGVYTRIL